MLNFAVPQKNPLGILMPRYDYGNVTFFVEELNKALYEMCLAEGGVHLIDFDAICSTLGKRFITDELTSHTNHGSFIFETRPYPTAWSTTA